MLLTSFLFISPTLKGFNLAIKWHRSNYISLNGLSILCHDIWYWYVFNDLSDSKNVKYDRHEWYFYYPTWVIWVHICRLNSVVGRQIGHIDWSNYTICFITCMSIECISFDLCSSKACNLWLLCICCCEWHFSSSIPINLNR